LKKKKKYPAKQNGLSSIH